MPALRTMTHDTTFPTTRKTKTMNAILPRRAA